MLVPSAVGGNIGRMEDILALPLAVALLWPRGAVGRRLVLPMVAVPLVLSQWGPAWAAMTTDAAQPSAQRSYFAPLVTALTQTAAGGPAGRVEVVPTKFHWEAAYVAPEVPLARGWERQLDEADNPLFYGPPRISTSPPIAPGWSTTASASWPWPMPRSTSRGWRKAGLVAAGVPGLRLVWRSAHWRLYQVDSSSGIVGGPAHLVSAQGGRVVVSTPVPGPVLVRVRYSPDWELTSGAGCIAPAPAPPGIQGGGTWVQVVTPVAERFTLRVSLLPGGNGCAAPR